MTDRLKGIRAKMKRAEKHVLDLQLAHKTFLDTCPYKVIREHEADTGEYHFRVGKIEDTPAAIMVITGDAIHIIRSMLDHLIYQLVLANNGVPGRHTGYPIFEDKQRYEAGKNGRIQGVSPIAADIIDATKPYKGGNDLFWILHELDIIDKHRQLIGSGWSFENIYFPAPSAPALRAFTSGHQFTGAPGSLQPTGPPRRLKTGDVLRSAKLKLDYDIDFGFAVAFDEPTVLQGEAVLETVKKLAHLVSQTVHYFSTLL